MKTEIKTTLGRIDTLLNLLYMGFLCGAEVKNLPANAGDTRDMGSIPGSGRFPGEGNGNPLQYSCLENSMEPGGLQCMGLQRVSTLMTEHTFYSTDEEIESQREYK